MTSLAIRNNVKGYVRDTYLGTTAKYNSAYPLIDCAVGSSQWGISEKARDTLLDHGMNQSYPELFYEQLLKPSILRKFGVAGLTSELVFFGHGSFNLAERLIHKLIEPDTMLGVGPQFNEIPSEFVAAGGKYHTVPIREPLYKFPIGGLLSGLASKPSVLYIDNPNNPLGRFMDLRVIETLVREAEMQNVIVIIDEAYADFVDDSQSAAQLVVHYSNLAVLRSFSKGLGLAAARVGYMFLSEKLADWYRPLDVPFEPGLPSASLAYATLQDLAFITRVRGETTETKSRLTLALSTQGFIVLPTDPATSIFTLHREGADLTKAFADIGISVEPGSAFRKTHELWDDSYCRIRLPKGGQVDEFEKRVRHLRI